MRRILLSFLLCCVTIFGQGATSFTWDHSPDASNTNYGYNFYVRTNGVSNTNFFKVGNTVYPTNVFVPVLPMGIPVSMYVTATNFSTFIESLPSNTLDWTVPFGVPPANVLTSFGITSYTPSSQTWNGVTLNWAAADFVKYALTNYTVVVESATITNRYSTVNNTFTLATLARDDYRLYVLTTNSAGTSPLTAGTTWVLSKAAPKSPTFLRAQ